MAERAYWTNQVATRRGRSWRGGPSPAGTAAAVRGVPALLLLGDD
eukprot:CAMPEP_0179322276 /NCGR_PEP_ID=MMETSP0797-20121207/59083_1 /TAXON_ID=47934 /ORGANISM="Dinophysis acuminata, Strain DAEP01" /LENGTH=44 /DNA_ID= /DNA_START= /DNA_END= /DNA_ORIENTATION=